MKPSSGLGASPPQRCNRCGRRARAAASASVAGAPVRRLAVAMHAAREARDTRAERRGGGGVHSLGANRAADEQRDTRRRERAEFGPRVPRRRQPLGRDAMRGPEDREQVRRLPRRVVPADHLEVEPRRAGAAHAMHRPYAPPPEPERQRPRSPPGRDRKARPGRDEGAARPGIQPRQRAEGQRQPRQRPPAERHRAERFAQPLRDAERLRGRPGTRVGQHPDRRVLAGFDAPVMDVPPPRRYQRAQAQDSQPQDNARWPSRMPPTGTGTPR